MSPGQSVVPDAGEGVEFREHAHGRSTAPICGHECRGHLSHSPLDSEALGLQVKGPFKTPEDRIGFAGWWGQPTDRSLRDEFGCSEHDGVASDVIVPALSGTDLILAANERILVKSGSVIRSTGGNNARDTLVIGDDS